MRQAFHTAKALPGAALCSPGSIPLQGGSEGQRPSEVTNERVLSLILHNFPARRVHAKNAPLRALFVQLRP